MFSLWQWVYVMKGVRILGFISTGGRVSLHQQTEIRGSETMLSSGHAPTIHSPCHLR